METLAIYFGKKLLGMIYKSGGRTYLKSKIDSPSSKIDDFVVSALDSELGYEEK